MCTHTHTRTHIHRKRSKNCINCILFVLQSIAVNSLDSIRSCANIQRIAASVQAKTILQGLYMSMKKLQMRFISNQILKLFAIHLHILGSHTRRNMSGIFVHSSTTKLHECLLFAVQGVSVSVFAKQNYVKFISNSTKVNTLTTICALFHRNEHSS